MVEDITHDYSQADGEDLPVLEGPTGWMIRNEYKYRPNLWISL